MAEGKDVILEVEIQGALKVKKRFPTRCFFCDASQCKGASPPSGRTQGDGDH